jgi:hypothetical protein
MSAIELCAVHVSLSFYCLLAFLFFFFLFFSLNDAYLDMIPALDEIGGNIECCLASDSLREKRRYRTYQKRERTLVTNAYCVHVMPRQPRSSFAVEYVDGRLFLRIRVLLAVIPRTLGFSGGRKRTLYAGL